MQGTGGGRQRKIQVTARRGRKRPGAYVSFLINLQSHCKFISNRIDDDTKMAQNFDILSGKECGKGALVCTANKFIPMNKDVNIIPVSYI